MRFVRGLIGFGGFVSALFAGSARAQNDGGLPAAASAGAPVTEESKPAAPARPATGYGYSDKPAPRPRRARANASRASDAGAAIVATLPGFEMLPDGGSRVFVELTGSPQVDEKKSAGSVTYVIKGARIVRRNNRNALETAHFNTPVLRARLIPSGKDLHFVVELRQNVAPAWKLTANTTAAAAPEAGARPEKAAEASKGATTMLAIEFPNGDFLPPQAETPPGKPRVPPSAPALPETAPSGGEDKSHGAGPEF